MTTEAQQAYAAAEFDTASPQRLRLLLIEAAIGFVNDARDHALATHWAIAGNTFLQARRAIVELLASIKPEDSVCSTAERQLAGKVRALYAFVFRLLTEAQLYRDPERLDDALRLLAMERETWRQVCEHAPPTATGREVDPQPNATPFSMRA